MWPFHPQYKFPDLPLIKGNDIIGYNTDQTKLTTDYTNYAVDFIHRNVNKPFFLYLAHSMPHVPLAVSDKFKGKSELGLYGDVMMELDWSIGEILRTIREEGIEDNTLVILTSDNGPWANYGNHAGSSGGLREAKANTFNGGTRVPCFFYWKGEDSACQCLQSCVFQYRYSAYFGGDFGSEDAEIEDRRSEHAAYADGRPHYRGPQISLFLLS